MIEARSAAAGGTAAQAAPQASSATDCNLRWQLYFDARECLDFYESVLRGLDTDARPSCPVIAQPRDCEPPPTGISSK